MYLDHAATTPMRPEAAEAMAPYLAERFGNPSGLHGVSQAAKNALEGAREAAAELLGGTRPLEIVFTGGGSESDNLAVKGAALANGARRGVVTAAVEHEAVLASAEFVSAMGCPVSVVGVSPDGVVDPDEVAAAVDGDTAVVSVMAANNETGVIQPVRKIVEQVKAVSPDVPVHTDAVQMFVTEDVSIDQLGVDMITLSGHKFGGPQGVGLLWVRDGVKLEPAIHGGGQELGRRSGTHNVAGIVGMAAAMEAAARTRQSVRDVVRDVRDDFEARLTAAHPDAVVTASGEERLVQHSHFRIPGVLAETLLVLLDQAGLAAAAGSACHSGAIEVSHVLAAMGMDQRDAQECVRFSFGWTTAPGDGRKAADLVGAAVGSLR